jgi:hypothetical protein
MPGCWGGAAIAAHARFPSGKRTMWYTDGMTRNQVKEILDRVLSWPSERQADVAEVVTRMEEQDRSALRLTNEQLAEVRRRRAKKNPTYITLADARKRFRGLSVLGSSSTMKRLMISSVSLQKSPKTAELPPKTLSDEFSIRRNAWRRRASRRWDGLV